MLDAPVNSVFIVDDDEDDRESIRDAFTHSKHDFDYVFMQSGDQLMGHLATTVVPEKYPSLILLDLNMPGMNGKDVLREMKKDEALRPIPIIVITTSSSKKEREATYKLGANCFITKPDSYTELVAVANAIAKLWL